MADELAVWLYGERVAVIDRRRQHARVSTGRAVGDALALEEHDLELRIESTAVGLVSGL